MLYIISNLYVDAYIPIVVLGHFLEKTYSIVSNLKILLTAHIVYSFQKSRQHCSVKCVFQI